MNKIGINFENVLSIKKELGVSVVETLKTLKSIGVSSLDVSYDRLTHDNYYKDILVSGFEIGCVFCFLHLEIQNNVSLALEVIDYCSNKKIKQIMVLLPFKDVYQPTEIANIKQNLRRIVKYAENFCVKIGLENVGRKGYPAKDIEGTLDILKSVKGLGLIYDGGNFLLAGVNPLIALQSLKDYAIRLHLKDRALRYEDGTVLEKTLLGEDSCVVALGKGDSYIKDCLGVVSGAPVVIEFPFSQENIFEKVKESAIYLKTEVFND